MKTVFNYGLSTQWVTRVLIWATLGLGAIAPALAGDAIDLNINTKRGLQQKVTARFEHEGTVLVGQSETADAASKLPMKTVASMAYHQRLTGTVKDLQAIRFFGTADGKFKIDSGKTSSSLAKANRMIVARLKSLPGQRMQLASVASTLQQSELELIKNPADPLTYSRLLKKSSVKEGDKWEVDQEALADFLLVDRILFTDARMMLKTATSDQARVYLLGQVDATIDDVGTSMKIVAIFDIDLKTSMVTDVRLSIDENRQPGQLAPGFAGKSRVNIQLVADNSCPQLSTAFLKKQTQSRRIKQRLQWTSEEGEFALQYDPRWRMIASESEAAVLRYVDDGDLLAQCDIAQLPSRPANKPLTLEEYKREVLKIISLDQSAKLVDAKAMKTPSGLDALRIKFTGKEDGVPIQWIYYHVSSDDGRRLTFVFALEEEVANIFEPSDQRMVNGLNFFASNAKIASKPSSARNRRAGQTR